MQYFYFLEIIISYRRFCLFFFTSQQNISEEGKKKVSGSKQTELLL